MRTFPLMPSFWTQSFSNPRFWVWQGSNNSPALSGLTFQNADFGAIGGERAFTLAGAVFEAVPDFIQAHFEEAPRLDNLKVHGRWVRRHGAERTQAKSEWRNRWHAARHLGGRLRTWPMRAANGAWRRVSGGKPRYPGALAGAEAAGHSGARHRARAGVPRARDAVAALRGRLAAAVPVLEPRELGRGFALLGGAGLWVFLRLRTLNHAASPFWLATAGLFAMYFLAAQPYVAELRRAAEPHGFAGPVTAYAKLVPWLWSNPPPCYAGALDQNGKASKELTGLVEPVIGSTNAMREAFRLAFRNGSIVLDGGEDAVHRTYGCLYGIERYGENPVPSCRAS